MNREGRPLLALSLLAWLASCGGPAASSSPPSSGAAAPAAAVRPADALPVAAAPDIEIREANAAIVRGARVSFDGVAEGLAWPSLEKALGPRAAGDVVTVQVARDVPVDALLRAAWTVRAADVRVQSLDSAGVLRAVELRAKHADARRNGGCHLAVFVRPDGSLRIAAPGGPLEVRGDDPPAILARSLDEERARCPLAYVAFGAESDAAPWGTVFDLLVAVDRAKSAGEARYVLGQAMHAK